MVGGRWVLGAMGRALLSLLRLVVNRATALGVAWLLAVPSVLMWLLAHFAGMPVLLPWAHALESILYFYAVSGLIRYMLGDMRVTTDELVSAANNFTLLAWAFAYAFSACKAWVPGSFSGVSVPPQPRPWLELLFLSFSQLSGVGRSATVAV